jgi:two-component system sensor histidine kinase KdpD
MVYLLGLVPVAARYGRGASVLASVLSVAAFDFFFVPPSLTFAVADTEYLITFAVMLAVGLVISGLTARVRHQAEAARRREERTRALYRLSRELARTRGVDDLLAVSVRHVTEVFGGDVAVLLPAADHGFRAPDAVPPAFPVDAGEAAVARWAFEHRQPAGAGTDTLPGASALWVPLVAPRDALGALGLRLPKGQALDAPEQLHQLETFANQIALAVDRAQLATEAEAARLREETERLRSSLLSSVSHDLRTPLATIIGALTAILDPAGRLDASAQRELLESARGEAERLNRLVQDLLEMTRLESGALTVRRQWHAMEEVVGAALARLAPRLAGRAVDTRVPPDLPLVPIDDVLVGQVLLNLLENALKYTPADSPIAIRVTASDRNVTVEVADRGPGLPAGDEARVFEKFYRARPGRAEGAGLGLAIAKGIVEAHGGRMWAHNVPEGGVAFFFTLPLADAASTPVPADG